MWAFSLAPLPGYSMGQKCIMPLLIAGFGVSAFARPINIPPQPVSPYADTEVSTNIQFSASSEHTREIVRPQFAFLLHQTEVIP